MNYGWRGFTFDLPSGLDDESVLTFLHRRDGAVDLNLTVTRDALRGTLDAYLADAVGQMTKEVSGYRLVSKTPRAIAGRDGFVLEHTTTGKDGDGLCILQAYVPDGGHVLIVTGTVTQSERAQLLTAFDGVVNSLRARA